MNKINIFITVDTEHSIGGSFLNPEFSPVDNERHIYCKLGSKYYGIPLIIDIADRFGIKVVFFVEVINKFYFGNNETLHVVEYIMERGHEVQLHIHPTYLNFTLATPRKIEYSDLCGDYSLTKQVELIAQGKELLKIYGVDYVNAFRAGCFGANNDTLTALQRNGFLIDSSYNKAYLGGPCLLPNLGINDIVKCDGIYEFPITNFLEKTFLRKHRSMPLDVNGVSFEEMRHVIESSRRGVGPTNITIILHSFSFVKSYDVQYRKVRPRFEVIRRFKKLCGYLADNSKF